MHHSEILLISSAVGGASAVEEKEKMIDIGDLGTYDRDYDVGAVDFDEDSFYECSEGEEDYAHSSGVDVDDGIGDEEGLFSYDGDEGNNIGVGRLGNDDDEIVHHTIPCPNDKVGLIIGSKGIVIKSMMNRSKAKILVTADSQNGQTIRYVEITGTEKQVKGAKSMVECVIKHGQEALDQSGDASLALGIMTKFVDIPENQVRTLVGPKSSVLRSIIKDSKAGIVVSKETATLWRGGGGTAAAAAGKRRVSVKGTVGEVDCALQLLRAVLNNPDLEAVNEVSGGFEDVSGDNIGGISSSDDSIDRLAASMISFVSADFSAKGGSKHNPNPSTTSTKQPKQHKNKTTRTLTGKVNGNGGSYGSLASIASTVTAASNIINNNSSSNANANANTSRLFLTKQCPLSRVGSLIGTRGSVIREIMKRTGTIIMVGDIPDPLSGVDYREVTIRGPAGGVAEAEKLIQGIIDIGTKVLNGSV